MSKFIIGVYPSGGVMCKYFTRKKHTVNKPRIRYIMFCAKNFLPYKIYKVKNNFNNK